MLDVAEPTELFVCEQHDADIDQAERRNHHDRPHVDLRADFANAEAGQIKRGHIVGDMQCTARFQTLGDDCAEAERDAHNRHGDDAGKIIGVHRGKENGLDQDRDHGDLDPRAERLHDQTAENIFLGAALQHAQDRAENKAENGKPRVAGFSVHQIIRQSDRQRDHDRADEQAFEEYTEAEAAA